MKKRKKTNKSLIIEKILPITIGLLLLLNTHLNSKELSCNLEKNNLFNKKTEKYNNLITNLQTLIISSSWGLSSESIYSNTNKDGSVGLFPKEQKGEELIKTMNKNLTNSDLETIKAINKKINEKDKECQELSKFSIYSLNIILILYLISLFLSFQTHIAPGRE